MINFINRKSGGGGGDGSSLNIFTQLTEPTIKKGIWLQKEAEPEHYTYDEEVFIGGEWMAEGTHANIPVTFTNGTVVSIGTNIYLFWFTSLYKYDTLTDTWLQCQNIPYAFVDGRVAAIGTDIYMFGSNYYKNSSPYYPYSQYCYKYDTLTDTYTKMDDLIETFRAGGFAVSVGTNIYYGGSSIHSNYFYKYDTVNNTHVKLNNLRTSFDGGSAVALGTDIYMLPGMEMYKYDTLTDTYTSLAFNNYAMNGAAVTIADNCIYRFGGNYSSSYYPKAFKYEILTNTWKSIADSRGCNGGAAAFSGDKIYLFTETRNQVYALESKTYEQDNLVVISQGKYNNAGYEIELYSNSKDVVSPKYAFADAWYYTTQGGLEANIPTYYGDGTQWINIKNPPSNNEPNIGGDDEL